MQKVSTFLNNFRLAAFPIGLGVMSIMVGSTLNRVMIAELAMPATLVGLFFAVPLLMSPFRVWLGYRSDGFSLLGLRRESYIILGILVTALGLIVSTTVVLGDTRLNAAVIAALLLVFAIYGLGKNLASNTFQALLSDKFEGDQRGRAVSLLEVARMLGGIMGAGMLGAMLDPFSPARLTSIALGVAIFGFVFASFAIFKQEPKTETTQAAEEQAREVPFWTAVRTIVLADPQVRRFFVLVMLVILGTLTQDVVLEPYGALVFGMSVGETTQLTMFWGLGIMVSMLASGAILIKWLGHMRVMQIGAGITALVFVGVIMAGVLESVALLQIMTAAMGLGTGLAAAGLLTGVLEFTSVVRAGLLLGVWGLAHELGHAAGSIFAGGVVDTVSALGGQPVIAYGAVFAVEGILLISAVVLSSRIEMNASQALAESESEMLGEAVPAIAR